MRENIQLPQATHELMLSEDDKVSALNFCPSRSKQDFAEVVPHAAGRWIGRIHAAGAAAGKATAFALRRCGVVDRSLSQAGRASERLPTELTRFVIVFASSVAELARFVAAAATADFFWHGSYSFGAGLNGG
jgi:hypothetical protein